MTRFNTFLYFLVSAASLRGALAQYIGQIMLFAGSGSISGWQLCDGTTLSIMGNEQLFNVIGYTYGGDGIFGFNVPNLVNNIPLGAGGNYPVGFAGGSPTYNLQGVANGPIFLSSENLPPHTHDAQFIGNPQSTVFQSELLIAQTSGQSTAEPGGYIAQGSNSGTGAANIFAPPNTGAPLVPLASGGGVVNTISQGFVDISPAGQGAPIEVNIPVFMEGPTPLPPFLVLSYYICTSGVYPFGN